MEAETWEKVRNRNIEKYMEDQGNADSGRPWSALSNGSGGSQGGIGELNASVVSDFAASAVGIG